MIEESLPILQRRISLFRSCRDSASTSVGLDEKKHGHRVVRSVQNVCKLFELCAEDLLHDLEASTAHSLHHH